MLEQLETTVIVVSIQEATPCDDISVGQPVLAGELKRLSGNKYDAINYDGRFSKYPQATTFRILCVYCDPNKTSPVIKEGLLIMGVGLVVGLGLGLKALIQKRRKNRTV